MFNWEDPLADNHTPESAAARSQAEDFITATDTASENSTPATGATGLESIEMGAARIRVDDKKNHQLPC